MSLADRGHRVEASLFIRDSTYYGVVAFSKDGSNPFPTLQAFRMIE